MMLKARFDHRSGLFLWTDKVCRTGMGDPYRTLLGHFHHTRHYFWNLLVRDGDLLAKYLEILVTIRRITRRPAAPLPRPIGSSAASAYAASHPWIDFAETWARYIHIIDTLEAGEAEQLGMRVQPQADQSGHLLGNGSFDPYTAKFRSVIDAWFLLLSP